MTLAESSAYFLAGVRTSEADYSQPELPVHTKALSLLTEYFTPDTSVSEVTPANLRDFLARWCVEKAGASSRPDTKSQTGPAAGQTIVDSERSNASALAYSDIPKPSDLLASLAEFFKWTDEQTGADLSKRAEPVLLELSRSFPRALEITNLLSSRLRERGGAFGFPEFLTSFEEGGRSQYDIDTPGSVGALEGYFRIIQVEGSSVQAEELISEDRVWPIVFPAEVAALLDDQYIINLELVRSVAGWQIAGCGFAYPPGTDL